MHTLAVKTNYHHPEWDSLPGDCRSLAVHEVPWKLMKV